jgi:hypothetical protein
MFAAVSDKRRQHQQRRQRRKATGHPRPAGSSRDRRRAPGPLGVTSVAEADRELAVLMAEMARIAVDDVGDLADSLEAEQWASGMIGTWHVRPLLGADVDELFWPAIARALEEIGGAHALATLRALGAVGAGAHGRSASVAADRLAALGLPEPRWAAGLGRVQPVAAQLMYEPVFDDGVSVMIEFAAAAGQPHTLGIYVDHNMGGLVKNVFLAPESLGSLRKRMRRHGPGRDGLEFRELDLGEARARVDAALEMLDHTYDPPVDPDVRYLRALIDARLALLPDAATLPEDFEEMPVEDRWRLLEDFLDSPEGKRWQGDEDAEDVAHAAIDFGAGYNHGGPLRWSPVVVEIFMTDWLARKVAREPEFFARVPEVLSDWVAYAGHRQDVPAAPLREAIAAVKLYRKDMLDAVNDPDAWGPAKTLALAAQQAGVDLSDPSALGEFVERYNENLAA